MRSDKEILWAITKEYLEHRMCLEQDLAGSLYKDESENGDVPVYAKDEQLAIININGSLVDKPKYSGDSSYEEITKALSSAVDDGSINSILLNISSPGGMVTGGPELADEIKAAGRVKPIYAYADGMMASAAYWLGSSAKEIAASKTAQIGSIGVLATHIDLSKMLDNAGIKVTFITSGKYKAIGNFAEKLSDEGKDYIRERIDKVYSMFINDVSSNRSLSEEEAEKWADGQVFLAKEAKNVGLIDEISSLSAFITKIKGENPMKVEDVKKQFPDVYGAIFDSGMIKAKEGAKTELERAVSEATSAQKVEFLALFKAVCGEEIAAKFETVLNSGITAEQFNTFKAAGIIGNQQENDEGSKKKILDSLLAAQSDSVDQGDDKKGRTKAAEFEAKVTDYMQQFKCKRGEATTKVGLDNPRLRDAWLKSQQVA